MSVVDVDVELPSGLSLSNDICEYVGESAVGGGSAPQLRLPSWGVAVEVSDPPAFAARLRTGSPAVFCRVERGAVVFDVRTVAPDEIPHLARAIQYAQEGDEPDEE